MTAVILIYELIVLAMQQINTCSVHVDTTFWMKTVDPMKISHTTQCAYLVLLAVVIIFTFTDVLLKKCSRETSGFSPTMQKLQ